MNGEHSNAPAAVTTEQVASHTPSPWRDRAPRINDQVDENYRQITAGCGYFPDQNEDEPGTTGFKLTGFIKPADAHLITAAPDLYAALNEVHGSFDVQTMEEILRKDCDVHDDDEFCVNITGKQLRAINDAILKAEGKKP
jgi:hypothetical protein